MSTKSLKLAATALVALSAFLALAWGVRQAAVNPSAAGDAKESLWTLAKESQSFDSAVTEFHFFDYQNPNEFLAGSKPVVSSVGGYVFAKTAARTSVRFNATDDTVTFKEQNTFVFLPERSVSGGVKLTLDDFITSPNLPLFRQLAFATGPVPPLVPGAAVHRHFLLVQPSEAQVVAVQVVAAVRAVRAVRAQPAH
jgi:hypothetical protein